jgi:hypothetical protein
MLSEDASMLGISVEYLIGESLHTNRRKSGIEEEGIIRVIDHILEDNHTQLIAEVIEHLGLYLYMLSEHIEAHLLAAENIVFIALACSGKEDTVGEVSLVQKSCENVRLAVKAKAWYTVYNLSFNFAESKITLDLIITAF